MGNSVIINSNWDQASYIDINNETMPNDQLNIVDENEKRYHVTRSDVEDLLTIF